jgi:hypothetical protein
VLSEDEYQEKASNRFEQRLFNGKIVDGAVCSFPLSSSCRRGSMVAIELARDGGACDRGRPNVTLRRMAILVGHNRYLGMWTKPCLGQGSCQAISAC